MATKEELGKWDRAHLIHAFQPTGVEPSITFVGTKEGSHVTLVDIDGKEYFDLGSQVVNVSLGHGQKEIIDAVAQQVSKLQHTVTLFAFSNPATAECAYRLAQLVPPGLDHFLFASGGSEVTETAMKTARAYWQLQGSNKRMIVSLWNSYHGMSTLGSMSATGINMMWAGGGPARDYVHVPGYYCYRCLLEEEYPGCNMRCVKNLENTIVSLGPDNVAALIAEPVQGVGGSIAPPPEWWPMVRDICTKHDVLLIADEVMSGFCRTGKMFAVDHWNIKPDMMTVAKGITSGYIPFAALAINDKIWDFFKGEGKSFPTGGFTYSGHPVGAAAAIAAMNMYVRDKVCDNVVKVGAHVRERLEKEFLPLPHIGAIHGLGLFLGAELVTDKKTKGIPPIAATDELLRRGREKGLLFRCSMGDKIQITPPLISTVQEVDGALDILLSLVKDFDSCLKAV